MDNTEADVVDISPSQCPRCRAEVGEDDLASLPETLRSGVPAAMLTIRRDLWHNAWSFLAIVVLLASEWVLRRRWGLR